MSNHNNHCLCLRCWRSKMGDVQPSALASAPRDTCCRCGRDTDSGIYVRAHFSSMACAGVRGTHKNGLVATS